MSHENSSSGIALRETAGSHLVKNNPRSTADTLVNTVIESLHGQQFERADTVFVTDAEGGLEGIVRIIDLLAHSGSRIGEIMEPEHEAVRSGDDREQIAVLAMQLNSTLTLLLAVDLFARSSRTYRA